MTTLTQPLHSSVPGMIYPTQSSMLAGTPRDSAIVAQQESASRQALAGNLLSGGKMFRKKQKGGANTVIVPQFQMLYSPQGGVGQNPNNLIQNGSVISTQGSANSAYDKYATVTGGYKIKRGGNPDWNWGCYSGGKSMKRGRRTRNKKRTFRRRATKSKNRRSRRH